ncbi:hypothetical protein H1C71_018446 [Ictidomys tridecemlineatus]|nr:hypothetical protein H1C71_018446 [Ictidomys tridecemlineatus]
MTRRRSSQKGRVGWLGDPSGNKTRPLSPLTPGTVVCTGGSSGPRGPHRQRRCPRPPKVDDLLAWSSSFLATWHVQFLSPRTPSAHSFPGCHPPQGAPACPGPG